MTHQAAIEAHLLTRVRKLWRTYMMLTDLEAVFRSLKSELGLRPVYHLKGLCNLFSGLLMKSSG